MAKLIETKRLFKHINTMLVLFYTMFFVLNAQTPIYETIDISHGLPTNYVYRVLETQDGYMWICTEKGVCRYDGVELVCYNSSNGLPDNDYYLAYEDPMGRLWVNGVSQTLSCIYNDSIFNIHFSNNEFIERITVNDSMFYFHDDGVVVSVDSNFNVKRFALSEVNSHDAALSKYLSTLCQAKDTLLQSKDMVTESMTGKVKGTRYLRFCYYDSLQMKYIERKFPKLKAEFHAIIQHSYVDNKVQIYEDNHLIITDQQLSKFDTIHVDPQKDIYTNSAYLDSKDNLWICTKKGVLVQHKTQRDLDLLHYEETSDQNVTHILNYKDGYIFGNDLEQIYQYNGNSFKNIFSEKLSTRNNFYSIQIDGSNLYFSNGNNGLRKFNFDSREINYLIKREFVENRNIGNRYKGKEFALYSNHTFLLNRGLHIFNVEKNKFRTLLDDSFTDILYNDSDSIIWLCNKDHLYGYRFDEKESKATIFTKHDIKNIENLFLLDNGNVLASNFSGFNYICKPDTCIQIDVFTNEKINACKWYDGHFYISTLDVLYEVEDQKFGKRKKIFDFRTLGSNRKVNDFIFYNDRIIFATDDGIISAKKKGQEVNKETQYIPFYLDSINGIRSSNMLIESTVDLPYRNRNFELKYHSNIYSKIKDYKYEYQLTGIDNKVNVTQRRELLYSSLNPGSYILNIRATDNNGNYSSNKKILIRAAYPWWLQWYSLIVWSVLFLGLLFLVYKLLNRRVNNQIMYTKKLAELELNALQSQMNPHFVFNALNSIQNLVISNKSDLADKYLSRFSQLMRLFLESSKHKFISLSEELLIIKRYLEIEKLRFGDKLTYNITNELTELDEKILVPATILQPFVENALVHGLFHKIGPGNLDIRIRSEQNLIYIIITDDGVGRKYTKSVEKQKAYKSRGMEIINDKLNLLKKIEDVDISYVINDIDNLGKTGTEVTIKIINK